MDRSQGRPIALPSADGRKDVIRAQSVILRERQVAESDRFSRSRSGLCLDAYSEAKPRSVDSSSWLPQSPSVQAFGAV
jgi:hypothetical protein